MVAPDAVGEAVTAEITATFETVTVTAAVLVLPTVSTASAVMVCGPLANTEVSRVTFHRLVPVVICHAPLSTEISARRTETLSAAVPETVIGPDTVAPLDGDAMATDGGVASAGGGVP